MRGGDETNKYQTESQLMNHLQNYASRIKLIDFQQHYGPNICVLSGCQGFLFLFSTLFFNKVFVQEYLVVKVSLFLPRLRH